MMSMHKLMAGDGYTYLTRHVAAGDAGLGHADSLVAYYEATGNPPGRWLGRGLAGLGDDASGHLHPGAAVTEPAMAAVFRDGHDPLTGDPLGRSYRDRTDRAVVGYDLTFTVPKSASVLWALGDDATRATVHAAHRAAVDQALHFVERTVARTRVGHPGCRQVRTRGIIAAAFDHWDSHPGRADPLRRAAVGRRLRRLVDEASLADTHSLAAVVGQAEAAGAKVLLVGDHLQRGSVDAGGAFGMLARRGPTAELTSLRRFRHPWEARASLQLRRGQPAALDSYDAHGAFVRGPREQMLDAALGGYLTAGTAGRVAVLQAADNRTVRELNAMAHADGVRSGAVLEGGVELHDGLLAGVGDRVVTRRNHRRLRTGDGFVRNGNLWDVVGVEGDGALRVQPGRQPRAGRRAGVAPGGLRRRARRARLHDQHRADAGHDGRGDAYLAAPGMVREDLYVAESRGRDVNRVYVVTDGPDDGCVPGVTTPATSYRDVLDRILATSHAEPSATETWGTYHPSTPAPLPVPALRTPHDYGQSARSRLTAFRPPAAAPDLDPHALSL